MISLAMVILTLQRIRSLARTALSASMPFDLMRAFNSAIVVSVASFITENGEDWPSMRHVRAISATGMEDCCNVGGLIGEKCCDILARPSVVKE